MKLIFNFLLFSLIFLIFITFAFTCFAESAHKCNSEADIQIDRTCEKMDEIGTVTDNANKNIPESNQNALAVVPYNEQYLSLFYKPERTFTFAGREMVIKQAWASELGVSAVVWDAAVVLSEYIERNSDLVNRKSVIELGAGSGIVGITAAYLGGNVTVTERELALDYLTEVVKQNTNTETESVDVKVLDWRSDLKDFSNYFDVIVGADIIYIEETFNDLLKTLLHLSSKETMLLLSCRVRYDRDSKFLAMLTEHFTLKKVFVDKKREIFIYKAKRL